MTKFLILTEAGDNIGFGHYTRCSAIQNSLKQRGGNCKMLLNLKGKHDFSFDGKIVDWQIKKEELERWKEKGFLKVLVDSYIAGTRDYENLQMIFDKLFVIDDYNRIIYNADVLINPNVGASDLDYSNQGTPVYKGKDFVILRDAFRKGSTSTIKEQVEHIVITVGGSDYRNLIPKIITTVQKTLQKCKISVVAGSPALQNSLKKHFPIINVLGLLSAQEMFDIFQAGDIVITACGQTLHELASIGKPTIGICLDIDQVPNQNYYYKMGFIQPKIHYDNITPISQELLKLQSKNIRKQRQEIGLRTINIDGVENICEILST